MNISKLYEKRFNLKEQSEKNKIWSVLTKYFFQKFIEKNSTLVDVACGNGEFINLIEAQEKIAFDINPKSKETLNDNIKFINDSLFLMDKYIQNVDYVFCSNVLEHLNSKDDVIKAFEIFNKVLKIGGKVIILQPNIKYVKGGKYWDFIDHKLPLTDLSLIEASSLVNFKTIYCIKKFLPYSTKSSKPKWKWLIWLYLKTMPFSGFFFGEQSFLIMEKINV